MKVYVKKDKVLRLLGEGKVYSKKELVLKENGVTAVANPDGQDFGSESDAVNKINQELRKPGVDAVVTPKSDLPVAKNIQQQQQTADFQTTIPANNLNPSTLSKAAKDGQGEVKVQKPTTTGAIMSSVTPRKVMDEMRANSIPFTKSELTKFLKSL